MSMLTDQIDLVIGIDTDKQTHTAAFVDRLGALHEVFEVEANAAGYQRLLEAASEHPGERAWAVEGTEASLCQGLVFFGLWARTSGPVTCGVMRRSVAVVVRE